MQTTSRSGLPSLAPSADGTPVPSMPSSRMLKYERERVGGRNQYAQSDVKPPSVT